ncbi:hypothetical protein KY347_04825 [Candidatus Woesearchaeota archaeon]|nr:hypothetical protein [Candidatus Woesearchaeota archaeon]
MAYDSRGLHHFHKRKRIHEKHEPYPHQDKFKRFIDSTIYAVGIFGPVMTLPQLAKIWIEKNASGVSVISWGAYLFAAVFWLIYGILHKEKPIILTYALWIVLEAFIVLGTVLYG